MSRPLFCSVRNKLFTAVWKKWIRWNMGLCPLEGGSTGEWGFLEWLGGGLATMLHCDALLLIAPTCSLLFYVHFSRLGSPPDSLNYQLLSPPYNLFYLPNSVQLLYHIISWPYFPRPLFVTTYWKLYRSLTPLAIVVHFYHGSWLARYKM